ncbi:MAG: co-chaperone GroES [Chloroflexi bacterium]|nr:co-chaperone GroES [Chloroflexota bacterium]
MAVKLQPMGDRLVVKPIQSEEKTKSGIYIPDTAKEKPQEGKVIAVGPGRMTEEGRRIKIDGEELIIMRESDILAKKTKK